jgi:tRNA-2-methylthio-N6-dimethylallyladenosine synthase
MDDDVAEEKKARRLQEIVDLQQNNTWSRSEEFIGQTVSFGGESFKKKSTEEEFSGRNSQHAEQKARI